MQGLVILAATLYARLVHGLRVEGTENIPPGTRPGPLVVTINHTAGVDPLIAQVASPFEIRWMMARDMMVAALAPIWAWLEVIPVDRFGRDVSSAQAAVRHLRAGGVVGIFPEGFIERPPGRLLPFLPGTGVIIKRAGARVLPLVISGTPEAPRAWGSLWRLSRTRLRAHPVIDYSQSDLSAHEITEDLHTRYTAWMA